MAKYRNVSPQGDQIIEGRYVKHGDTFETDANLAGNPNFKQVKSTSHKGDDTEGNE